MNPYSGVSFWEFFPLFFSRLAKFLTGSLPFHELASDDVQVLVLALVAISASLVGSYLILRKMTMLANALSHTILIGIVAVFLFTQEGLFDHAGKIDITAMLIAAVAMGLITAFLTQFLTRVLHLQEDASTGLVFTGLFALGITLVTLLTRSAHIGTEIVMGNVDSLHADDLKLVFYILAINLAVFFLFHKEYLITTFDPALATSLGFSVLFFDYLLMTQTSITSVGAFRAVGVLMVLAFITGPPLTARLLTHSLSSLIFLAMAIGSAASLLGVATSRHLLSLYDLPVSTGGIVVLWIIAFFLLAALFAPDVGILRSSKTRPVH